MAAGHAPSPPAARDRSPPRPLRPAGPAGPDHGARAPARRNPGVDSTARSRQFAVGGQQQGGVAAIAGVRDHRRQQRRAQPRPCCGKATDISSRNNDPSMGSASANPPGWPSASATHSSPAACAGAGHPRARYRPRRPSAWACRRTRGSRALDGGKAGNIGKKSGSDGHGAQSMPQSTAACRRGRRGPTGGSRASPISGFRPRRPHRPAFTHELEHFLRLGLRPARFAARPPCCSS